MAALGIGSFMLAALALFRGVGLHLICLFSRTTQAGACG
jgi:hypothetical protein